MAPLSNSARRIYVRLAIIAVALVIAYFYNPFGLETQAQEMTTEEAAPARADLSAAQANVAVEQADLSAVSDADGVRSVVRAKFGQLKYCYEKSLKGNPQLAGKVEVEFDIKNTRVTSASASVNTTGDEAFAQCIVGKIERWTFPESVEGKIVYPFIFSPEEPAPEPTDAAAKETAWTLINALSNNISSIPQAQDTSIAPPALAQAVDGEDALRQTLTDPEEAGKYIHALRMKGLVPATKINWLDNFSSDDNLVGVVTLKDGRERSIKFEIEDEKVKSIERASTSDVNAEAMTEGLIATILDGQTKAVWAQGHKDLKKHRTADQLFADLMADEIFRIIKDDDGAPVIEWDKATNIEGGFRLNGTATISKEAAPLYAAPLAWIFGAEADKLPLYVALLDGPEGPQLLDIQSTAGFAQNIVTGSGRGLDIALTIVFLAIALGGLYLAYRYITGLWDSPREIWLLFFTKVTEYSAYGSAQIAFMFYLRNDIGMSDVSAGWYYGAWSTSLTALTMVVGAVCDAIGIKRTLLIGAVCLMASRALMPFADDIIIATICGFVPMAIGIAITGPVLSVGIKRYTTMEGAAMGFAAFYTLMNVGWAVGAWIFDTVRVSMGEMGSMNVLGSELSTYQVIIGIGFFINLPDFIAILVMRRGVNMTEKGAKIIKPEKGDRSKGLMTLMTNTITGAAKDTVRIFGQNFVQRAFWIFILLIGVTVFARLIFFHFHLTWPSYGARYLGEGSLIANLFGVLNPVLIVILAPLIGLLTRKISSYKMLLLGTVISVGSAVFVIMPIESFAWLEHTWFGAVVFDHWLQVPVGFRTPFYLGMTIFVIVFTLGEAIWSPRLMQFTAEIAPPGREGSYIALAYLPYFGAKFIAAPMAGMLLSTYTPEFGIDGQYMNYPNHQMIWWWIAGTAALTPVGLVVLRNLYKNAEDRAREAALAAAEAEGATA